MKRILALDIAKGKTGWAYHTDGSWYLGWNWGVLPNQIPANRQRVINCAVEAGCTHAALEDPFIGPNAKSGLDLAKSYGRWEADCERYGLTVIKNSLRASDWQRHMLVINGKRAPAGMSKVWAREVAKSLTGYTFRESEQDAADAVCLAAYVESLDRMELLEV